MVRLEFQVNTKMLTVLTGNIIDQNYFGYIDHYLTLVTVSAQSEMTYFTMKKINTKAILYIYNYIYIYI